MDYRERITMEPGKRSGKPYVRGLRITVHDVLGYFASGREERAIVRKDSDFNDILLLRGCPPYVVWTRRRNCSTDEIESLIRSWKSQVGTCA